MPYLLNNFSCYFSNLIIFLLELFKVKCVWSIATRTSQETNTCGFFVFCFFKGTVLPWVLISSILYEVSLQRWPPRQHLPLGPKSLGDHQDTLQDPFPKSPFIVIELTLWGYFDFFLTNTQDEPVEVQSPFFCPYSPFHRVRPYPSLGHIIHVESLQCTRKSQVNWEISFFPSDHLWQYQMGLVPALISRAPTFTNCLGQWFTTPMNIRSICGAI